MKVIGKEAVSVLANQIPKLGSSLSHFAPLVEQPREYGGTQAFPDEVTARSGSGLRDHTYTTYRSIRPPLVNSPEG